jgi:hypothetical protein
VVLVNAQSEVSWGDREALLAPVLTDSVNSTPGPRVALHLGCGEGGWPVDKHRRSQARGWRVSDPLEAEGREPARIRPGIAVISIHPVAGVSAGVETFSVRDRCVAGPARTVTAVGPGTCQC